MHRNVLFTMGNFPTFSRLDYGQTPISTAKNSTENHPPQWYQARGSCRSRTWSRWSSSRRPCTRCRWAGRADRSETRRTASPRSDTPGRTRPSTTADGNCSFGIFPPCPPSYESEVYDTIQLVFGKVEGGMRVTLIFGVTVLT